MSRRWWRRRIKSDARRLRARWKWRRSCKKGMGEMLDFINSLLYDWLHVQIWFYARANDARGPHSYCTNALRMWDIWCHWRMGCAIWFKIQ